MNIKVQCYFSYSLNIFVIMFAFHVLSLSGEWTAH